MPTSQAKAILIHLRQGKPITPIDALQQFDCFRLGARIWDLKRKGYAIESRLVEDPASGKRYAEYRLARRRKAAA